MAAIKPTTIVTPGAPMPQSPDDPVSDEIPAGVSGATAPRRRGRPRLGRAVARELSRDEEILKIAAEVVWRKGFSGTKLSDIAEAAGIVKGSLYHYFDSKEEIYERLIANVRGVFEVDLEIVADGPAAERLDRFIRSRIAMILRHPLEVALLVRDLVRMKGPAGDWAREAPKNYYATLRHLIIQGQKEGSFRAVDPDVVASVIQGVLAHLPNWYRSSGRVDAEALTNEMTEYVLAGLVGGPARPATGGE